MVKKDIIAMLLAGGQGSRLGALTNNKAKPAVTFGGKYKIIDFPMSNCINAGIDTVGVLTQYEPLLLNKHIGIGIPWDLDKKSGGVTVLTPHVKGDLGEWYTGTANAIYQNMSYIESHNPKYVLVLSGDHVYKMDYSKMLDFHEKNNCDVSIAVLDVSYEEAKAFGTVITDENNKIHEFEEKPENPRSTLVSMGIYIFTWAKLKDVLIEDKKIHPDSDFGKHIIPTMLNENMNLYAYKFSNYWRDVGTIESYWNANMDLIKTVPEFNLYEDFWDIFTDSRHQSPSYAASTSNISSSLISEGCEIYGSVHNSVIGIGVVIEEGAVVKDSIIMNDCIIAKDSVIERSIIDSNSFIGSNTKIGIGENVPNKINSKVYYCGITVIGENTVIPPWVNIGKNCVIVGSTSISDYVGNTLESGESILKVKEEASQ